METWSILLVINIITCIISNFIFLPIEIYYFNKFKQFDYTCIVARRDVALSKTVLITNSILGFALYYFLMPVLRYYEIHVTTEWAVWALFSINQFVAIGYFFYVTRLWLIFYSIMVNYET